MTEYFDFINESGPGAISAARASYGLDDGYQDSTVVPGRSSLSDALRLICPEIYPSGSRNIKVTSDNGQTYKIDFQGRPSEAYTGIGKKLDRGGRLTDKCRKKLKSIGESGDQAGHLIPREQGGPPIRANLVPQNGNLNQGVWRSHFEGAMLKCALNPGILGYYKVEPLYADHSRLRPDKLKVTMQIHSWGFDPRNERYGEYYVPNAPSDWYDGEGRRLVDNWKKLFELCG